MINPLRGRRLAALPFLGLGIFTQCAPACVLEAPAAPVGIEDAATGEARTPKPHPPHPHATTTTVALPPTTTAVTTTTTVRPGGSGYIPTLPVGAALPSDATCAGRVRRMTENRPLNAPFNARRGTSPHDEYPRVTGNFTGTTDEIIQWAACKHGLDTDWARAQASIESWWRQNDSFGDFGTDPAGCLPGHPIGADGRPGECPESVGLLQVRFPYHQGAFEDNNAILSTAYNADYAWQLWRDCYDGKVTWLNTVERGREYTAGDALGCMGVWFSGRWYTSAAVGYMNRVRDEFYAPRVWGQSNFPPALPL